MVHPNKQSGNVFFALFGAVGLVGVLGAASMTIMKGPVRSMHTVTKNTVAENQMIAAGRLSLIAAAQQPTADCDSDGYVEPVEWSTTGTGVAPTGGGFLPATIGSAQQDPWGNTFGYCVWDHGAQINNAGCGGASQKRRAGTAAETQIAIAVISSGPDRVFQTSCVNHPTYISRVSGSDDLILQYTYAESKQLAGGLWTEKTGSPGVAEISKDLEVKKDGTVIFGVDSTTTPTKPAIKVDFIQKLASLKGVTFLSNIILGTSWLSGDGDNEGVYISSGGNVGVGTATPTYKLDVEGNAAISSTLDVTQPVGSTSARALRVGYEDNNNYARLYAYGSAHATLPGRLLIDNVSSGSNTNGGYIDFRPEAKYMMLYASGAADGYMRFYTGTTESMRILANGNTGIGLTAPTVPLQIKNAPLDAELGAGSGSFMIGAETSTNMMMDNNEIFHRNNGVLSPLYLNNAGTRINSGLWLGESSDTTVAADIRMTEAGLIAADNHLFLNINGDGGTGGTFSIRTGGYTTPTGTELMRVTSAGRVGVNVTGPRAPLHVKGEGRFSSTSKYLTTYPPGTESNGFAMVVEGVGNGDYGGMLILVDDNNNDEKAIDIYNTSTDKRIFMAKSGGDLYMGGTLTIDGNIYSPGNFSIYSDNNTGAMTLYSGVNSSGGGGIIMYGSGHASGVGRMYMNAGAAAGASALYFRNYTAGAWSNLGIWNANGNLTVYGSTTNCVIGSGTGSTNCTSDERLKKDIETIKDPLNIILQSRGVRYHWNEKTKFDTTKDRVGVIAQEMQKVLPEAVMKDEDGYLSVDMTGYIPVLIEAVKDLKHLFDELVEKVASLFEVTNALKADNAALKEDIIRMKADHAKEMDALKERMEKLETAR